MTSPYLSSDENRKIEINELQEKVRNLEAAVKEIDRTFHVVFGMEGFNDGSMDDAPFGPPPWSRCSEINPGTKGRWNSESNRS